MISIIIPAYNEENNISQSINSIKTAMAFSGIPYDITVVDNGSTDKTVEAAQQYGANVFIDKEATIGELRNIGVRHTQGDILLFIDADVCLTESWGNAISNIINYLASNPFTITGSQCSVPDDMSFVELYWYLPVEKKEHQHGINSGHMIMTRQLFRALGGFDKELESGEDIDISKRALRLGGKMENFPQLKAVHYGFPKTLYSFFKRMRWHGKGGLKSSKSFYSALLTNLVLFIISLGMPVLRLPSFLFFIGISIKTNKARCGKLSCGGLILAGTMIIARTISVFDVILKHKRLRGTRTR